MKSKKDCEGKTTPGTDALVGIGSSPAAEGGKKLEFSSRKKGLVACCKQCKSLIRLECAEGEVPPFPLCSVCSSQQNGEKRENPETEKKKKKKKKKKPPPSFLTI
eukprot:TRINITY_DN6388_c0_g1_i8.p2 TRINITY_DN6388_c0_g1~~TRINITY_DN6388_c0_g1_i8.p2  ORF type:complete len:105 (+),score=26.48 TRINITY_DN6388_c0_g1_i8:250-564(+)